MQRYDLPTPLYEGNVSVEEAIYKRYSCREFMRRGLSQKEVSQLLFCTQGAPKHGYRTVPSAGATYPLQIYALIAEVEQISPGIYHYLHRQHKIELIKEGDLREQLSEACLSQRFIVMAPVVILVAADYSKTVLRYGERGMRYVHMEVGHVGQNLHLQAVALNLGCVMVGAFYDTQVKELFSLPKNEDPLYIVPVGHPR